MKVRKEIHIIWNPTFKYGGTISVMGRKYHEDGTYDMTFLSNGFWTKNRAWEFAESLRQHSPQPILNDCIGLGAID